MKLKELDLSNNCIVKIEGLENLTNLQILNMSGNLIEHIPIWMGKRLKSLRAFHVGRNRLESVSESLILFLEIIHGQMKYAYFCWKNYLTLWFDLIILLEHLPLQLSLWCKLFSKQFLSWLVSCTWRLRINLFKSCRRKFLRLIRVYKKMFSVLKYEIDYLRLNCWRSLIEKW